MGSNSADIRVLQPLTLARTHGPSPGGLIPVKRLVLQSARDALFRAVNATHHAHTILANGATAFEQEAINLQSALDAVDLALAP